MAAWRPEIISGPQPVYARIVDALERDVAAGKLVEGARLPPHRELAFTLGVGVGTVTRAYVEAERRGLITGHVGRGSFIRSGEASQFADPPAHNGLIDLARNMPPAAARAREIGEALGRLRSRPTSRPARGMGPRKAWNGSGRAGAAWLRRRYGLERGHQDLIQCGGAQQGVALAFLGPCAVPATQSFAKARPSWGSRSRPNISPVSSTASPWTRGAFPPSPRPRGRPYRRSSLIVQPTLHNPTTRTMTLARRLEPCRGGAAARPGASRTPPTRPMPIRKRGSPRSPTRRPSGLSTSSAHPRLWRLAFGWG